MSDIEGAGMSTLEETAAELAKVPWTYYMYITEGTERKLEVRRSRGLHGLYQTETKVLTTDEVAALVWPGEQG